MSIVRVDSRGLADVRKSEFRRMVSRLAATANKRIQRLEKNNLTDSPAYQKLVENGEPKFGVRGKTYNEVQAELSRINKFLDSQTSTIRGINQSLKTIAKNTGLKYRNLKDLKSKASKFFELADKVEQYLRNVEDSASAIGYHRIWEVINEYVKSSKVDLSNSENSIDEMVQQITEILNYDKTSDKIEGSFHDFDNKDGWVIL